MLSDSETLTSTRDDTDYTKKENSALRAIRFGLMPICLRLNKFKSQNGSEI